MSDFWFETEMWVTYTVYSTRTCRGVAWAKNQHKITLVSFAIKSGWRQFQLALLSTFSHCTELLVASTVFQQERCGHRQTNNSQTKQVKITEKKTANKRGRKTTTQKQINYEQWRVWENVNFVSWIKWTESFIKKMKRRLMLQSATNWGEQVRKCATARWCKTQRCDCERYKSDSSDVPITVA